MLSYLAKMSSSLSRDASSDVPTSDTQDAPGKVQRKGKNWVQFDDETVPARLKPPAAVERIEENIRDATNPDTVAMTVGRESTSENEILEGKEKVARTEYSGAVIATESVHINLDRSGINRTISAEGPDLNLPSDVRGIPEQKSASLKTIDLRDTSNGRSADDNIVNTPIGNIRQGFANGDTIVTLLPINTRWPWITPAKFRPELVPEELMAQGLTVS